MEVARAEAEKIKLIGGSEATAIEAVGKAEAERMRLKASAYKQYGDAAMLSLVLETLPKVCILVVLEVVQDLSFEGENNNLGFQSVRLQQCVFKSPLCVRFIKDIIK